MQLVRASFERDARASPLVVYTENYKYSISFLLHDDNGCVHGPNATVNE